MTLPIKRAPQGATHELKEVEVFEVSLVDHDAIMRGFLVVKGDKTMPVGQPLQDDGSGGLTPAIALKAFDDAAKKKLKGKLTSAAGQLNKLIDSIEGASDEGPLMKSAAGIGATLSKFAPASDSADKSEEVTPDPLASNETEPPSERSAPSLADVQALAARTVKSSESTRAEELRKRTKRDAKVDQHLAILTRAAHTLTAIAVRKNASGTRPAPAAQTAGEINPLPSAPIWRSDMNSEGIPADEQFV